MDLFLYHTKNDQISENCGLSGLKEVVKQKQTQGRHLLGD